MNTRVVRYVCNVEFPSFTGARVLMMPFHVHDPAGSLPGALQQYVPLLRKVLRLDPTEGVGYLTVDESWLAAGEYHRRPGKHVDGVGEDGSVGAIWGGGGGGWGSGGMYLAASVLGCRAWDGPLSGSPGPDGDCAHLRPLGDEVLMRANEAYWCHPLALHESLPVTATCGRQFVRVSMPNRAPWHEGCTPSPLGIMPEGPVAPRRSKQMAHRP